LSYYSNKQKNNFRSYLITAPDPPRDLSIDVQSGKSVELDWKPPLQGSVSGYKVTIVPLSEQDETGIRNIDVGNNDALPIAVRDLTPGASYEVQLHSVLLNKPSNVFLSANFTTKPNTPGRFIVWFRNETTLLVLWQPPYPAGIFDQYRVSIIPEDAVQSVLYVEKETEPPGPAQAAFYGLVPGRAYNISVQTVSQSQISDPTEAQYRTVPLPPTNVTFDRNTVSSYSFDVQWGPPKSLSEFDRYQVSLGVRHSLPKIVSKDEVRVAHFSEDLEPGKTYEVVVKSVSGNVASWPVTGNITTRPLPVIDLKSRPGKVSDIYLEWTANNESTQDSYMVTYHELEAFNSDGSVQVVKDTHLHLSNLLAGRNYSITVVAISKNIYSENTVIYQPTRPASPVIGVLEPISGRTLNVSWKWDVTSKQDSYKIVWTRNDTKEKKDRIIKSNWLVLEDLYPGAGYEISVSAISYGLMSDPHSYFQTVLPRPPEVLQIAKHTNSTMLLTWSPPLESLVDHYVVRYRPFGFTVWRELSAVNSTSIEIKELTAGERYVVRVATVSNKAESPDIREVELTMYPNPITDVKHTLDSHNITFQWTVPQGRIDFYNIAYNTVGETQKQESKQIPATNDTKVGEFMSVLIDSLKPGEQYSFRFYVVSHNLRSEGIGLQIRTSEYLNCLK
jgi:cadherin 5 type 2 (VE-cadherin)